jgi:hypothetical protein
MNATKHEYASTSVPDRTTRLPTEAMCNARAVGNSVDGVETPPLRMHGTAIVVGGSKRNESSPSDDVDEKKREE